MWKTVVPIPTPMQCVPQRKTGQMQRPLRSVQDALGAVSRGTGMYYDRSTMSGRPISLALSFTLERLGQPRGNWDPKQRPRDYVSTYS